MHKISGGVMKLVKREWNGKRERHVAEQDTYNVSIAGGSFVSEGQHYPFISVLAIASGDNEQEVKENMQKGWYYLKEHVI